MNTLSSYIRLTDVSESNRIQLLALANSMTSTDAALAQMTEDYPLSALQWMKKCQWEWPHAVSLADIDFSNKAAWNAQADQYKVKLFKKKIMKGTMKPSLLVRPKGESKYVVVDGHHRALTCLLLKRPLMAWTADTPTKNGPWDTMHDTQTSGSSIKTSNLLPLAADSMAKASTPEPVGPGELWHKKDPSFHLPYYIQHVANDIRDSGKSESEAIAIAISTIKRWAAGGTTGKGIKVHPDTQAAAQKALAEWNALKAKAHASK